MATQVRAPKRINNPAGPIALTINESAEALRVSPRTLQKLISDGEIRPARIGRRVLLTPAELERFVHERAER